MINKIVELIKEILLVSLGIWFFISGNSILGFCLATYFFCDAIGYLCLFAHHLIYGYTSCFWRVHISSKRLIPNWIYLVKLSGLTAVSSLLGFHWLALFLFINTLGEFFFGYPPTEFDKKIAENDLTSE